MRCPGGIQLELPLIAVSLSVCFLCSLPAGYILSNLNQIQGILVDFTNSSLHAHYGSTPSRPTLLLVWGVIASLLNFSACTTLWLAYPLKRRFGCKKALFQLGCGSLAIGAIADCIAKYAGSVELFIIGMLFSGFGLGLSVNSLAPTYLSECSPPNLRGFTTMAITLGIYAGSLLAFVLGLPSAMGTEELWGLYMFLPAVFAAIGVLLSRWIPDSPKDLYITLNDKSTARINVSFLYGEEHHNIDAVMNDFHEEHEQTKEEFKILHLLTEGHLRRALVVSSLTSGLGATCGPFALLLFSNAVFLNLGLPISAAGSLTIAMIPLVPLLTPFSAVLIERLGRRQLLLGFGSAMIIALVLYVVCGTLAVQLYPEAIWLKYLAAIGVLVNVWLVPFGPVTISQLLPTELFPHHARTAAVVVSAMVLMGCATIVVAVFPSLLDACGPLAAFVVCVVPSVVFLVALWWLMPETAGKPVNEIVRHFMDEAETRRLAQAADSSYGSMQATSTC